MFSSHGDMVKALSKNGADIIYDLTSEKAHLLHMAVGVAGEAGELLDAVKKAVIYGKRLDRENVIEELGDLEFYMEGIRQVTGITRENTIDHNIDKLSNGRYKSGSYSDEQAINREDKV